VTLDDLSGQEMTVPNEKVGPAAYKVKLRDLLASLVSGPETVLVKVLSEALAVGDFTDEGAASGYKDLVAALPKGAVVLGWKFVGTGAFDGDTSAVMQVGVPGVLDRFSADTSGSVFVVATIASLAKVVDVSDGTQAESMVRVTVTTGADFTACKAANHGDGTLYLYYLDTE
jgi:hypothetical protein